MELPQNDIRIPPRTALVLLMSSAATVALAILVDAWFA